MDKLQKFAKERTIEKLTISTDVYTKDRNLIVIHGIKTEESAKGIAHVLKDYKDYMIVEPSTVISTDNYKIVQVYKNLEEYIAGKGPTFVPKTKPTIVLPKKEETTSKEEILKKNAKSEEGKMSDEQPDMGPPKSPSNPGSNCNTPESIRKNMEKEDGPLQSLPSKPVKP
jgi:hypothetical protein